MELTLKHIEHSNHPISGAYIKGTDPHVWLQEIGLWGMKPHEIACFVVPQGANSIEPSGLLVAFSKPTQLPYPIFRYPYRLVAKKLFIPWDAALYPEVGDNEISKLLHYDTLMFHPSIGLVGFEEYERLQLVDLVSVSPPIASEWLPLPKHGAIFPPLLRASVEQPEPKEILDLLKENVGSKPLGDIKNHGNDKEDTPLTKIKDAASLTGLKGLAALTGGMGMLLGGFSSAEDYQKASSGKGLTELMQNEPGLIDKLHNWVQQKIENLEQKRESELQRLMDMFDKDNDEALQYAIPLNSNYLNRGDAPQNWQLQRQNTNFSLNRMGGGGRVDGWDIGSFYNDLRTKYIASAQKEKDKGNYKKAAYIYAHLLADFYSAATTLKEGKLYREAATIYLEHLKNPTLAAECLEDAGLYQEALDIYITLNQNEKVGDLYIELLQPQKANQFYERCAVAALLNKNHVEAARIQREKKKEHDRALQTLLTGWTEATQADECLTQYFQQFSLTEPTKLSEQVQYVYDNKTPKAQNRIRFLHVIAKLVAATDEDTRKTSKAIAYDIVSQELQRGNGTVLNLLKNFVPVDNQIAQDINRYLSTNKPIRRFDKESNTIQLPEDYTWLIAIQIGGSAYVAFGESRNGQKQLMVARGNWMGEIESQLFVASGANWETTSIAADNMFTQSVFLLNNEPLASIVTKLPNTEQFANAVDIYCPKWLPASRIGTVITGTDRITILCQENEKAHPTLHQYSFQGKLIGIQPCSFANPLSEVHSLHTISKIHYRRNSYYFTFENCILHIDEKDMIREYGFDCQFHLLEAAGHYASHKFLAATSEGCAIYQADFKGIKQLGPYFAKDAVPRALLFIPDNKIGIIEHCKISIYDVKSKTPQILGYIETEVGIVSAIPTKRDTLAVLDTAGLISVHELQF